MKFRNVFAITVALFLVCITASGQPGGGGNPGGGPPVPITGIEILIALGGFFGLKKLLESKKSR